MASLFSEFRYSREASEHQLDVLRIFDRTLEWGSLATAGYIIVAMLRSPAAGINYAVVINLQESTEIHHAN